MRIAGGADYEKTLARIRNVAGGTPGIHSTVTTYEDDRSADVLEGPSSALDVRVYGHDYGVLRQGAAKARSEAQQTMALVREAVGMQPRPVA